MAASIQISSCKLCSSAWVIWATAAPPNFFRGVVVGTPLSACLSVAPVIRQSKRTVAAPGRRSGGVSGRGSKQAFERGLARLALQPPAAGRPGGELAVPHHHVPADDGVDHLSLQGGTDKGAVLSFAVQVLG